MSSRRRQNQTQRRPAEQPQAARPEGSCGARRSWPTSTATAGRASRSCWSTGPATTTGRSPGKLDKGETFEQAALREVAEETGLVCDLGRAALDDLPRRQGRSKLVRYWSMRRSSPGRPTTRSTTAAVTDDARGRPHLRYDRLLLERLRGQRWLTPAGRDLLAGAHHRASWHNVAAAFTSGSPAPSPDRSPAVPTVLSGTGAGTHPRQQPRGGHQVRATEQRRSAWLSIIVAVGLVPACGGDDDDDAAADGATEADGGEVEATINISGSSTVEPISSLAAEAFCAARTAAPRSRSTGRAPGTASSCSAYRRHRDLRRLPGHRRGGGRACEEAGTSTSSCRSPTTAWPS